MAELPPIQAKLDGPFRTNVWQLLSEVGEAQPYGLAGTSKWVVRIADGQGGTEDLLVFEENVAATGRLYCEQCRVIGWGHHPVSCSRFHFILPSADSAALLDTNERHCPSCEATCPAVSSECPQCNADLRRSSALEVQSHLLHGVLHSNGFGHLLRINGRERGSRVLSGTQLMDLWDHLCRRLKARDVSVQDLSKKYGLDLRLLHAVAYGSTWYGRWGYQFGRGSFGVSADAYVEAVALLQNLPLDTISDHFALVDHQVVAIVAKYRNMVGQEMRTLSELYRYMLESRPKLPDGGRTPEGDLSVGQAVGKRLIGLKKTGGTREGNGKGSKGRGLIGGAQQNGPSRGLLQGPPLVGVARARTQHTRRPAKGFVFRLRIGLGKKSSSPGSPKLTKSQSPGGPGIKSPRFEKNPGLSPAKSPKPSKSLTPKAQKADRSNPVSPVKSPRRSRDPGMKSLVASSKPGTTPDSPQKRKPEPGTREESPAPRRTRQRLEEEARVLGMSGAGFQRDGSLDSEAALRKKAKRTRLEEEGGALPADDVSLASPLGGNPSGTDGSGMGDREASPIPRETDSVPAASGTRNGDPPRTPRTPAVRRTPKRPPRHGRTDPGEALQLSYSPPEKTPDREIGESGRAMGRPPIPEGSMSKLVRTFDSSRESTRSPSVESSKSRYTPRRIDDAIKALVSIIRALPENTWMTRVSLKEKARSKIGDTGLLNYALRVVENLEVGGGAVVRRMVHPDSHVMEYRLEYTGSGSPSEPPMPSAGSTRDAGSVAANHEAGANNWSAPAGSFGTGPAMPENQVLTEASPTESAGISQVGEASAEGDAHASDAALSVAPRTEDAGRSSIQGASRGGDFERGQSLRPAHIMGAAPLRGGAGSQSVRRSIELPDFDARDGVEGKDTERRRKEERTPETKLGRMDGGWRVERPRRAIVSPQKAAPGGRADVSGPTLTKADVVKDLRYLHQQVVLTYKAARKIRRTGPAEPAPASTPTTPFGGLETPLGSTPLGNGAHFEKGEGDRDDVAALEKGLRIEVTRKRGMVQHLHELRPSDGVANLDGADGCMPGAVKGATKGGDVMDEEETVGEKEKKNRDTASCVGFAAASEQALQAEGDGEQPASGREEREGRNETGPERNGATWEHSGDERPQKEEMGNAEKKAARGVNGLSGALHTPKLTPIDPVAVLRASKVIHNSKKFIKSYHGERSEPRCQVLGEEPIRVLFGVRLQDRGPNPRAKCDPPPELVVLNKDATVKDLKAAAGAAFQEVYVMLTNFRITRVDGWGGTSDKAPLAPLLAKETRLRDAQNHAARKETGVSDGKEEQDSGWNDRSELVAGTVKAEPYEESAVFVRGDGSGTKAEPGGTAFGTSAVTVGSCSIWADQNGDEGKQPCLSGSAPDCAASAGGLRLKSPKAGPDLEGRYRGSRVGVGSKMEDAEEAAAPSHPLSEAAPGPLSDTPRSLRSSGTGARDAQTPGKPGLPQTHSDPLWNLTGTGTGADLSSEARFEAGLEIWVVDCLCGTKDDDGERMAECDRCGTWMHTRCLNIRDRDDVPAVVVCLRCSPGEAHGPKGKGFKKTPKGPQKGVQGFFQPPSSEPTNRAHADPVVESEQTPALQPVNGELQKDAPKRPGERRPDGLQPGPSVLGTKGKTGKRVANGGARSQVNGGGGDGEDFDEPGEKAQAQTGVKRKRSAAVGDRKVRNDLGHLGAAVRDMAGVASVGPAALAGHVALDHDNGVVKAGKQNPFGKARSKRGGANAQDGHPLKRKEPEEESG